MELDSACRNGGSARRIESAASPAPSASHRFERSAERGARVGLDGGASSYPGKHAMRFKRMAPGVKEPEASGDDYEEVSKPDP